MREADILPMPNWEFNEFIDCMYEANRDEANPTDAEAEARYLNRKYRKLKAQRTVDE